MAQYYGNAFLTISASVAVEPGQGCFSKASSQTGTINMANGNDFLYAVHYRLPLSHVENPLHVRGWIHQEYTLSRRVVHFLADEVIWECREATWCECGRVADDFSGTFFVGPIADSALQSFAYRRKPRFYTSLYNASENEPGRLKNLWMEIVHEYSQKKLTFAKDVFPALAGLAKEMQKQRKCGYYAGLWEDSLVSDLLWDAEDLEWYPVGHEYAAPEEWRAPSWSWASSTATINWPHCPIDSMTGEFVDNDLMSEIYVSDLKAECQASGGGDDVFMGLASAELSLTGSLGVASIVLDEEAGYIMSPNPEGDSIAIDHTLKPDEIVDPSLLRALLITKINAGENGQYKSLLLKPTGSTPNQFVRIGLMHHTSRFEEIEKDTRITLL